MEKAVVVFSGGQDSTTCLGWAQNRYGVVMAITFQYGQKHEREVKAASDICDLMGVHQTIVDLSFLPGLVNSALTSFGNVNKQHPDNENLPASFVPNRNALFLTLAHAYAQKVKASAVVSGVCQTDYSGYPDCREGFVQTLGLALNAGSDTDIQIVTPLMHLTKAETFKMANDEDVLEFVLQHSVTCYNAVGTRNVWGYGCGHCPACALRSKGWHEFKQMEVR